MILPIYQTTVTRTASQSSGRINEGRVSSLGDHPDGPSNCATHILEVVCLLGVKLGGCSDGHDGRMGWGDVGCVCGLALGWRGKRGSGESSEPRGAGLPSPSFARLASSISNPDHAHKSNRTTHSTVIREPVCLKDSAWPTSLLFDLPSDVRSSPRVLAPGYPLSPQRSTDPPLETGTDMSRYQQTNDGYARPNAR